MKICTRIFLTLLLSLPFAMAQAQISPALTIFNSETGLLKIPALVFNGSVYYLELSVADAVALTMKIEESSLVDVSPTEALNGNTTDAIVGTWGVDGETGTSFTFNADATWEMTQAAGVDEAECPEGGVESGTFRYTSATGVFMPVFLVNENGSCGLSSSTGVVRLIPDGNTMSVLIGTETGATLTKQ